MKTFYQILLCFFMVPSVFAECFPVEVKFIFKRKEEISKEIFCEYKTPDKFLFYVSKGCEGIRGDRCEILRRPQKTLVIKDYRSNIGSPGFKLCRALNGLPQIFEWKRDGKTGEEKWQSTERCLVGKEFVEIGLLTKIWKKNII